MSAFDSFREDPFTLDLLNQCQVDVARFFELITGYYDILIEVNQTLNLTRITSPEEFWVKHVLDALMIINEVPQLADPEAKVRLVDIGCGGGVPLIPLSIAFPHATFVGFESRRKKVFFILEAIESLELENVAAFPFRAIEASHKDDFKGYFDVATARAVARLEKLIPETKRFIKDQGRMVFYKTPQQLDEEWESAARAANANGLKLQRGQDLLLPGENGQRQFALLSLRPEKAGKGTKKRRK